MVVDHRGLHLLDLFHRGIRVGFQVCAGLLDDLLAVLAGDCFLVEGGFLSQVLDREADAIRPGERIETDPVVDLLDGDFLGALHGPTPFG